MSDKSMRFVFFGTPEPAVEILEALYAAGYIPALIVTNPDRPQGRNMVLTQSLVKKWALAHGISILQPKSPSDPGFFYKLKAKSYQLFLVVAYGSILPKEVLSIPKCGTLNLHYSLLPKYRGASPIESEILNDDSEVGVSILLLDEKMDHGPIVAQKYLQLTTYSPPERTKDGSSVRADLQLSWPPKASELRKTSNKLGAELFIETIPRFVNGKIKAKPQDHAKATYTRKFTKADGEIKLEENPYKNFLKIRAFEDSIGAYFFAPASSNSPILKRSGESARWRDVNNPRSDKNRSTPFSKGDKIRVLVKDAKYIGGKLILTRVIPEGKKEMSYEEFLRGLK